MTRSVDQSLVSGSAAEPRSNDVQHPLKGGTGELVGVVRQIDAHRSDTGFVGHDDSTELAERVEQQLVLPHHARSEGGDVVGDRLVEQ